MRLKFIKFVCLLLSFSVFALSGCVPSLEFLNKKEQGLYPTTADFPNTKWVCRELEMFFYMFEYEEDYMIGSYVIDGISYRVVAKFEWDQLNFEIYSSTMFSASEYSKSMVHCNRISSGYINTSYSYDKDSGTIICSLNDYYAVNNEVIPMKLTFEKTEAITHNPILRWHAQEMDMYFDAFDNMDYYLAGEMFIAGQKCRIHALEIGNGGYYMLSIENGKINNLKQGTTSLLVNMCFEIKDNQIIAKVSDEYILNTETFPYWPSDITTIVFDLITS